jgi:hypothetical protein
MRCTLALDTENDVSLDPVSRRITKFDRIANILACGRPTAGHHKRRTRFIDGFFQVRVTREPELGWLDVVP